MNPRHKPLAEQTIVITGASSGLGLVTAKLAAKRGASVVLVARGEEGLDRAVAEIRAEGGEALCIVADVTDPDDMVRVADTVIREYEGFDSWVNNAGVGLYGRLDELHLADKRRLFDVNFWGVIHGCRAAPLLGAYSASKHAVKAYVDTLRMELEADAIPVSISLVKPTSMDTPFFEHAKNYMDVAAAPLPPVYDPAIGAEAILACCERPIRDVIVGGAVAMMSAMGRLTPRLADKYLEATAFDQQRDEAHPPVGTHALFEPMPGSERGRYAGHVMKSSLWTTAELNPLATAMVAAGVAGLAIGALKLFGGRGDASATRQAVAGDRALARAVTPRADLAPVSDVAEGGAHVPDAVPPGTLNDRADETMDVRGAPLARSWAESNPSRTEGEAF